MSDRLLIIHLQLQTIFNQPSTNHPNIFSILLKAVIQQTRCQSSDEWEGQRNVDIVSTQEATISPWVEHICL